MFHNSFKLAKRYKKVRSLFSHFQTQFPKWSAKIGASSLARAPKRSPTQNSNSPRRLASFLSASPPLLTPPTPLSFPLPLPLASPLHAAPAARRLRRAAPPTRAAPLVVRRGCPPLSPPPVSASASRVRSPPSLSVRLRSKRVLVGGGGFFFFGSYVVFKRASRFADRAVGCRRE
jgi:hypothetical protein